MQKKNIKQVVVVEGHTDTNKLKKLFLVDTIETNGSAVSNETINLIKIAEKKRGVILFLDPDGPGENIRKKISLHLNKFENVFIDKKSFNPNSKKIGIAEAPDELIIEAFKNIISFDKKNNTLSWDEYISLNLNSKNKRKIISDHYKISECNHKQMFKRLNMMGIKFNEIKELFKHG